MDKPVIAVDIDDVLADSTEALRLEVNDRLKVELTAEHYKIPGDYRRYYESIWKRHGLESRINMKDLDPRMAEDQSHIEPNQQAEEVLRRLSERYSLIVVTSRPATWRKATERWLERHFKDMFSQILFIEETEGETKGRLCREHDADWLIDDNVEHAQSAVDEGLEVILFGDYGWHHKVPAHFHRCKNWRQVLEYFNARG